jgi:hypothetical protein
VRRLVSPHSKNAKQLGADKSLNQKGFIFWHFTADGLILSLASVFPCCYRDILGMLGWQELAP